MVSIISAQSGRRIKTAPTPMNSANTTEQVPKEIGYSESSGSASIPIFAKSRRDNKPKNEKKSKNQKTKSIQKDVEDIDGEEIVSIESSLVTVPVTVLNRNGIYVPGLQQENFQIFENGVEQEVAYFGTADKPFTVIMLIDISPSTLYKIEEIQAAARSFVDLLKPEDSVMVISFDQRVNVLTEPTKDRERIFRAINRANFGNGTSLYEAVAFALGRRLERIEGRKAVLLLPTALIQRPAEIIIIRRCAMRTKPTR
jgi:Mg-chelatase subunit ChlD